MMMPKTTGVKPGSYKLGAIPPHKDVNCDGKKLMIKSAVSTSGKAHGRGYKSSGAAGYSKTKNY